MRRDFDRQWKSLGEEVLCGIKEWRMQHPRATLKEIEVAIDERLAVLRARMVTDVALASAAAKWEQEEGAEQPTCPHCGAKLKQRGVRATRHLQTHGGARGPSGAGVWSLSGVWGGVFPPWMKN